MSQKKKMLYVQTSGVDTPERTYAPFILATTAAMMNIEATIYFLIKGVTVVKKGEAEKNQNRQLPITQRGNRPSHKSWGQTTGL